MLRSIAHIVRFVGRAAQPEEGRRRSVRVRKQEGKVQILAPGLGLFVANSGNQDGDRNGKYG
jgi:hypothetical protein